MHQHAHYSYTKYFPRAVQIQLLPLDSFLSSFDDSFMGKQPVALVGTLCKVMEKENSRKE